MQAKDRQKEILEQALAVQQETEGRMKAHGKGLGISINGGTSTINKFKMLLANASEGVEVREFKPLVSWPAAAHPRQAEIDALRVIPSRYV